MEMRQACVRVETYHAIVACCMVRMSVLGPHDAKKMLPSPGHESWKHSPQEWVCVRVLDLHPQDHTYTPS
ncbi:hypothetical protein GW17_00031802 [Ensete ventricosum]|nr:hypothetical protein GW17_00031802 [Ensete ventricosum]